MVKLVATLSSYGRRAVVVGGVADRYACELARAGQSNRRRAGTGSASPERATRAPLWPAGMAEGNRETFGPRVGLSSHGSPAKGGPKSKCLARVKIARTSAGPPSLPISDLSRFLLRTCPAFSSCSSAFSCPAFLSPIRPARFLLSRFLPQYRTCPAFSPLSRFLPPDLSRFLPPLSRFLPSVPLSPPCPAFSPLSRFLPPRATKDPAERSAVHARWKSPGSLPGSQFELGCGWPAGTLTTLPRTVLVRRLPRPAGKESGRPRLGGARGRFSGGGSIEGGLEGQIGSQAGERRMQKPGDWWSHRVVNVPCFWQ